MEMVNGYVFLDLTKSNVYSKALKVLGTDKPVVIKDGSGSPYFVDSLTLDGTNVVITKGGKTITIANDNTITNEGLVANPTMENIVDLNGNRRFIEGNGEGITQEGITITYNKWSLSGTHLMLVLAGSIANSTVVDASTILTSYKLPKWILDKIFVTYGDVVEVKQISIYNDSGQSQSIVNFTRKATDEIRIVNVGFTASDDRNFRIQFDLLIDND